MVGDSLQSENPATKHTNKNNPIWIHVFFEQRKQVVKLKQLFKRGSLNPKYNFRFLFLQSFIFAAVALCWDLPCLHIDGELEMWDYVRRGVKDGAEIKVGCKAACRCFRWLGLALKSADLLRLGWSYLCCQFEPFSSFLKNYSFLLLLKGD